MKNPSSRRNGYDETKLHKESLKLVFLNPLYLILAGVQVNYSILTAIAVVGVGAGFGFLFFGNKLYF
jgi:hypothetical protein